MRLQRFNSYLYYVDNIKMDKTKEEDEMHKYKIMQFNRKYNKEKKNLSLTKAIAIATTPIVSIIYKRYSP